jgi:SLIT-ROBO Rho GTPase activating protein
MMDAYNLAICFGPTLLPIPPDRDQVSYQSNVHEVVKTVIVHVGNGHISSLNA